VVAAGAIAQQILGRHHIKIQSYVKAVGEMELKKNHTELDLNSIDSNPVRCPDEKFASSMEELILETKAKGDTIGGVIRCVVKNVPVGLGEPLFEKLNANIAKAMFSINAVKGVAFGDGFDGAKSYGSIENDVFEKTDKGWHTLTNHSGGIQGGISNGMDIYFDVAFKPVSTLMLPQTTANVDGEQQLMEPSGRHDSCVVPRAVPIVDAFTAIIVLNHMLMKQSGMGI
jgi:chorismate synthase